MPKGGRRRRDPNKPKRGKSAFLLFSQYTRPAVIEEHPSMTFAELAKEVARRWKIIDPDEKAELEAKSKIDRERYNEEMKSYEPPPESPDGKKRRRRQKKEGPKRNVSSFMWFCKEARSKTKEANPEASMTQISSLLGKQWNSMDTVARQPFEKLAAQDKERYQRESKAYQEAKAKTMAAMAAEALAEDVEDVYDEGEGYADYGGA